MGEAATYPIACQARNRAALLLDGEWPCDHRALSAVCQTRTQMRPAVVLRIILLEYLLELFAQQAKYALSSF